MAIPKIKMPQIGGLDGIKDKLGFGNGTDEDGNYGEYDDFDGGFDDGFDDGFEDYDSPRNGRRSDGYRDIDPIDASPSSRVRPVQASSGGYSRGGYSGSPDLVSLDDVKAHTAASGGYGRAAGNQRGTEAYYSNSEPASSDRGFSGTSSASCEGASGSRSRGYDSLFSGTSRAASASRPIQVVRPFSYEEAEKVAVALRRGDVVVLDLAATDQALYKRILDFSFGAACMVNARVDCLANRIFSIQTGERLSREELDQLRSQGVM